MIAANVSMICDISAGGSPPADAVSTALTDAFATANITTSVTPMTTPIAMRLDRSG